MKKIFYFLIIFITFSGCSFNFNKRETILDYFPFLENTTYIYKSEDNIGNQEIYTTYIRNNKIQQRIIAPNNEITVVLEYSDGELKQKFINPSFYMYEDLTDSDSNTDVVILKEPLKVGKKWNLPNNGESIITNMNVKIDTPLGEFETLEVTTKTNNVEEEKTYYAKGIGVVKTEYSTVRDGNKRHVVSYLQNINKNQDMEVDLDLYYPDENTESLKLETKKLKIKTNENFKKLFKKCIEEFAKEHNLYLISQNTIINSISVDRKKSIVNIDLSSHFVKEMNLGASYENILLKSIAYTLCNFYKVKHMKLTIDGLNYSSGHLLFEDDDVISLD